MKLLVLLLIPLLAAAEPREQLGTLKIEELVLRPQFRLREPAAGDFQLGESMFSLRWQMDSAVSGVIAVGSAELIGKAHNFTDQINTDLKFIEAYAEYASPYGIFRAGMQPVRFGVEGRERESDLQIGRSLFYQRRLLALRDIGFSYEIENNGFFTSFMIHNGESDTNLDGRIFYTANWGWIQSNRLQIGAAGTTGTTKPVSTSTSNDTIAGVDPTQAAQWRMMGPFILWTPPRWRIDLEAYAGEMVQLKEVRKYSAGHLEVGFDFKSGIGVMGRYDRFDPNHQKDGDTITQASLGVSWKSQRENSRIYLVATKVIEESTQIPNDEIRLIWHLTPFIR